VWVARATTPIVPRVRLVWEEGWVHFISTMGDDPERGGGVTD
jgi:hypothetical protein